MTSPGGVLQTTDKGMQTGITALETAVSDCNGIYNQVMDTVSALPQSWQSESATAFQSLLSTWQDDFHRIITALQGLHDNLVVNKQTYDQMESHNTETATH
jgi:WXG100 family type VII secretion target